MLIQWKYGSILKYEQESGGKDKMWKLQCSGRRNVAGAKSSPLFITEEIVYAKSNCTGVREKIPINLCAAGLSLQLV